MTEYAYYDAVSRRGLSSVLTRPVVTLGTVAYRIGGPAAVRRWG
jgi:hypothetical protein